MAGQIFKTVETYKPRRSVFDLSHSRKFSFQMGDLVPIFCEDVVPGDMFRLNASSMIRLAPMVAPIMHEVDVECHFFFIPYRLIWDDSQKFFISEDPSESPIWPYFPVYNFNGIAPFFKPGSLSDYLGFPSPSALPSQPNAWSISALPFRAYNLVYNEWYRDQNLIDEVIVPKTSGRQASADFSFFSEQLSLKKRAWEKDYFTSALPTPQRGTDVSLPLAGQAPVELRDDITPQNNPGFFRLDGDISGSTGHESADLFNYGQPNFGTLATKSSATGLSHYDPNGTLIANLSEANSTTLNNVRTAAALQQYYELLNRGGSRYTEFILAQFGVRSSDARLNRPEFLGGGRSPMVISEVLQTSETQDSPQGNMAGHGISVGRSHEFKKFFEEHGIVLGIMSVKPRTAYQQGLPRKWTKFDKFDHFIPILQHLGEQPIYNREIYLDSDQSDPDGIFGYTPRYSEYRYYPSTVHGDFRGNLSYWHMGRIFGAPPRLNADFVSSDPTQRIFSVTDSNVDKLWCQVVFDCKAIRPMSKYATPGLRYF